MVQAGTAKGRVEEQHRHVFLLRYVFAEFRPKIITVSEGRVRDARPRVHKYGLGQIGRVTGGEVHLVKPLFLLVQTYGIYPVVVSAVDVYGTSLGYRVAHDQKYLPYSNALHANHVRNYSRLPGTHFQIIRAPRSFDATGTCIPRSLHGKGCPTGGRALSGHPGHQAGLHAFHLFLRPTRNPDRSPVLAVALEY